MFYTDNYNGFSIIKSDLFDKYNIKHFFSTKKDISESFADAISFGKDVSPQQRSESYKKAAAYFSSQPSSMIRPHQTHSANVQIVDESFCGFGITKDETIDNTDAIITDKENLPLLVFTADCVPVLIADKGGKVVCAVHSGWRGTKGKIALNAVKLMKETYAIASKDIICAIGPCIGRCCFEVGKEVYDNFSEYKSCSIKKSNGKYNLDLKEINRFILKEAGVYDTHIDVCPLCTFCESELFHSYRRDGAGTGRMAALIMKTQEVL